MDVLVPCMLLLSSVLMAFAWLGHIRFRHKGVLTALLISWLIVLPEYVLNITAFRWGTAWYTPSEMAAINLCSGVLCVALVSRFFLNERMNRWQLSGFLLMAVAVSLIIYTPDV